MLQKPFHILLIDADLAYVERVLQAFAASAGAFQVLAAASLIEARAALETQLPDLIITEWALPDAGALELLAASAFRGRPSIVLTHTSDLRSAVAAIKHGALEYLLKSEIAPADLPQLAQRVIHEYECLAEQLEYKFTRNDGTALWTQLASNAITDIAERRAMLEAERMSLVERVEARTVELRAANAQLARAARLKDEFLASMSHELRTPLNTILGMSETMLERTYGPLTDEQAESLQSIEQSGRHLLALINDILDLSTIEAGRLVLDSGPVVIEEIVQSSLRMIKQPAHQKRLTVALDRDSAVVMITADARRLKQMLFNLLSNAVKFTPEGGTIGLDLAGDAPQGVVRLTVWDTGIGIERQNLKQLFQPFIQLDSRLSRQYMGSGLGLVLVARMAQLHGGSIAVESTLGQGSRFTIELPWAGPSAADLAPDAPAADHDQIQPALIDQDSLPNAGRPHILLADDNSDNVFMFSRYLRIHGYAVVVALNGAAVLEQARALRPDLILMDVQMPGIDGFEATRRIRADAALASIPIIGLTAFALPRDRARCLEAGMNAYLSKPVVLQDLVAQIQALLAGVHGAMVPDS